MGFSEIKFAVLSSLPSIWDYKPSRFARKVSMCVGYACIICFAVWIAIAASPKWLTVDYSRNVTVGRGTKVLMNTTGFCSLTACDFIEVNGFTGESDHLQGDPTSLTTAPSLTPLSKAVLAFCIVTIILCPVAAVFAHIHGWSKLKSQKTSFIMDASMLIFLWLLSTIAWAMYIAARPKSVVESHGGYQFGWGFWLLLAMSFVWLILVIVSFIDKPKGLFVYSNGEFQKEEERGATNARAYSSFMEDSGEGEEEDVPPPVPARKQDPLKKQLVWTD